MWTRGFVDNTGIITVIYKMGEQNGVSRFPFEIEELKPEEKQEVARLYSTLSLDYCTLYWNPFLESSDRVTVLRQLFNDFPSQKKDVLCERHRTCCQYMQTADACKITATILRCSLISSEVNTQNSSDPDFVKIGPKKYMFLRSYCEDAENIYNMPLRPSDIFVVTYQRAGTTWTQELVWLVANNLDYETARKIPLTQRYPFLELYMFFHKKWQDNLLKKSEDKVKAQAMIDTIAKPITGRLLTVPSPRFIKTHVPLSLLPPKLVDTAKVVYVARDPRDVAVSCYHHSRLFGVLDFPGPFKDFWNLFIRDQFILLPYFDHVKEAWECRDHPNMLFLFYEELAKDLPSVIRRVAKFLGKELTSDEIAGLCDHLSFENFKKNDSVNFEELREFNVLSPDEVFIRKGKAGGWRSYFDEEMTQQADQWIEENLRDTDLRFPNL